ncbi:hypothetical protein AVEN_29749-1 [Araneus ventricosus]|uniref:Uncharacterized protein n=1 Tax=Araneus ventricosus TaxID=182803 RepID=A0A4Y2VNJ1_ARAVE|nr:hypothetical protein AVEN_29749-1 [Araneus ventricosus]
MFRSKYQIHQPNKFMPLKTSSAIIYSPEPKTRAEKWRTSGKTFSASGYLQCRNVGPSQLDRWGEVSDVEVKEGYDGSDGKTFRGPSWNQSPSPITSMEEKFSVNHLRTKCENGVFGMLGVTFYFRFFSYSMEVGSFCHDLLLEKGLFLELSVVGFSLHVRVRRGFIRKWWFEV